MLPFEPEHLGSMQRRVEAALIETYTGGVWPYPSERRINVFDWPDGLRIITAFIRCRPGAEGVFRLSCRLLRCASVSPLVAAWEVARQPHPRLEAMLGFRVPLDRIGWSEGGTEWIGPTRAAFDGLRNRAAVAVPAGASLEGA